MIFGAVFVLALLAWIGAMVHRSPYVTMASVIREQPVPFSHEHHFAGLGIDCRYCHTSVETSSFAGIPPIKTCMTCHSKIWTSADLLEPIRASWRTGVALQWQRVHILPDYVFFNHSIHVQKGMGCSTCHGRVDQMPLMAKVASMQMEWCLQCHREPERFIRPEAEIFNMQWEPPDNQSELGRQLVKEYNIPVRRLTDCYTCHR
jgi:NAD-dependent SIR2 family protein deacetylase